MTWNSPIEKGCIRGIRGVLFIFAASGKSKFQIPNYVFDSDVIQAGMSVFA